MNTSDVSLEDMSNEVLISVCEHVKCIDSRYVKCNSNRCM